MSIFRRRPRADRDPVQRELEDYDIATEHLAKIAEREYDFDAIDLFSGIGWDAAARALGMRVLGLDFDKDVTKIRRAEGMASLQVNLWEFRPEHMVLSFRGLIGSPSCKKWSISGKKEAHSELGRILAAAPKVAQGAAVQDVLKDMDPEAALVLAPLAWAVHHRPEWIALEQVKQVQPVWDAIAEELSQRGYSVDTGVLSAEQFGSGQQRERSVLVANRTTDVRLPVPTHSRYYNKTPEKLDPGVEKWRTVADVLGWGPQDRFGFPRRADGRGEVIEIDGEQYRGRDLRPASLPSQTVTEKARSWSRFPGDDDASEAPEAKRGAQPAKAENGDLPGWVFERPSTTVVASFRPDILAGPGWRKAGDGPRQNAPGSVQITVEETAKLQSFPDDIAWGALSKTSAHKVIGNAVDGRVARATIQAARGVTA